MIAPARVPRLYLVTDRHLVAGASLTDTVDRALRGGVDAVQLREKDLPTRDLMALGHDLAALCRQHGARLLINDRIDVALAVGADGVHLPSSSFLPRDARTLLGPDKIVAVSCHSVDEVRRASTDSADFIVFGPVYATPSKAAYGEPQGLDQLRHAVDASAVPVVAIGGIGSDNCAAVAASGASGCAVIRALLLSEDPNTTAADLLHPFSR